MDSDSLKASFLSHLRHERGLAESTAATYGFHLRGYLESLSRAGCKTAEATPEHVAAHIGGLRARGLKSAPIFCAVASIRALYRYLLAKGLAAADPTVGLKAPKLTCRTPEPLTVGEVDRLLSAVPGHGFAHIRDRAILEVLYGCGLRIGEALGLDLGHVHLGEGYVRVLGKGSRERLVPVGDKATEALKTYLEARDSRFSLPDGPLFLSRNGARLKKGGFGQRLTRYGRRAGIAKRVHPHVLRHTCALHLLLGGADLRSLQLLLGHLSLTTTQRYLRLDFNALRETCRRAHPRF